MNKELTAMQILIEELECLADKFQPNTDAKRIYLGLRDKIVDMNLLKKEQEQIEKAFDAGITDVFDSAFDKDDVKGSGKDYYRSKYGGEDEVAP